MSENDFKTGEIVLASNHQPVSSSGIEMVYLCTINQSNHLCITHEEWENEDFSYACNYAFIERPKTCIKVKKASEIIAWLEDNGYEPTKQGSWIHADITKPVFSRTMFIECGKDVYRAKKPGKFIKEWLKEEILC